MQKELMQIAGKKARSRLRLRLTVAIPALLIVTVLLTSMVFFKITETKLASIGISQENKQLIRNSHITVLWSSVFFATLAGIILGYTIVIPIKRITSTVDKLASGDLSRTIQIDTHAEFDQLGDSFNRMVSNLRNFVYERNKYIFESMVGGVVTLDNQGMITMINSAAETMLGLPTSDRLGKLFFDTVPQVPDNQRLFHLIHSGLEDHKTFSSIELDIFSTQNKRVPIGITTSLLKDKDNQLTGLVVIFKDLTKQKQIQQQLHRSDRLAAIGTLATAMAHEIRNPLGSMRSMAQLLQEDMSPDDQKSRYIKVIIKETDRLNKIIEELLNFAQSASGGMELGDFNAVVKQALAVAKQYPHQKTNVQVQQEYDTQIPELKMEKEKLNQALLNLIINAFDAVPENGSVEVKTRFAPTSLDYAVPNRGFALCEVKNDGDTIPPQDYERIFDPFYTTKPNGTGLGLSIAHQIVAAHGGLIQVESVRGESTIFRVRLPILIETEGDKI